MLEIGKMLSAEAIVIGSIGLVGSKYVLSAKMLETETARTLSTADGIYGDLDELLKNISGIAEKLSKPYAVTAAAFPGPDMGAPVKPNIPAIVTLAGGLVSSGMGAYFLAVSLPLLIEYTNTKASYDDADTGDIGALYAAYEAARQAAVDGNANINFIIGASLAGAGIALVTLSIILFNRTPKKEGPKVDLAFLPGTAVSTLALNVRY